MQNTKTCPRCKINQGVERFANNKTTRDRLQVFCRPCMSECSRISASKKPEQYALARRANYQRRSAMGEIKLDPVAALKRYKKFVENNPERRREHITRYIRTPKGWISTSLQGMRQKSKRRGHPTPELNSIAAIAEWLISTSFDDLWSAYVLSGYETDRRPSIDRLDNAKPYARDNIRLVTWRENLMAAARDCRRAANERRVHSSSIGA